LVGQGSFVEQDHLVGHRQSPNTATFSSDPNIVVTLKAWFSQRVNINPRLSRMLLGRAKCRPST
jgi:hypothetical protein